MEATSEQTLSVSEAQRKLNELQREAAEIEHQAVEAEARQVQAKINELIKEQQAQFNLYATLNSQAKAARAKADELARHIAHLQSRGHDLTTGWGE
jgi:phage shock protein A